MGEEKNIVENDLIGNSLDNASVQNATVAQQQSTAEQRTEHSHHHHHHSGSHHHHHSSSHHRSGSHRKHSRHRRHRSKKNGIVSRFRKFFNKLNNKKRISFVCALALSVILIFSVGLDVIDYVLYLQAEKQALEGNDDSNNTNVLKVEVLNPSGMLVTDTVKRFLGVDLLAEYNSRVRISNFAVSGERYDVQNAVSLKLSTTRTHASAYKIELADNAQFRNATVDFLDASTGTYSFEHLYTNTRYYYRVTAYTETGAVSQTGWFNTADTPRILSIDGISNVRDIGNWKTDSGKRIKQGLLIRGTELDGAKESVYHLTNQGMDDMLNVLGIKTDMDLRSETDVPYASDALGSRVTHKYYNMGLSDVYGAIFDTDVQPTVAEIFTDLANKDNYPIYIHCTYGRDRTGTICYILEAVLGVSRGDCLKDYGLSNASVDSIRVVEAGLMSYGENLSLKEQAELYLISCGITMDQINAIRDIFLGE